MTKGELRQMIREMLHEELNRARLTEASMSKSKLKYNKSAQLKEARTSVEIMAEIERLKRELEQAITAEKRAFYSGDFPTEVYAWDMYIVPADKGTFCSAEKYRGVWDGVVYETEDDAIAAGRYHLHELDDEGELSDDPAEYVEPEDYTIDVFAIPLKDVPKSVLDQSNLSHLI